MLVKGKTYVYNENMKNDELIKQIAQPILEQLEKYENLVGTDKIRALPEIRFVLERNHDGPIMIGDIELTDELLHEVELYLQEQIEMKHKPTVLH